MSMDRRILTGIIRFYQRWIGSGFPSACRFAPSCSAYAVEAIERHGSVRGLWLTVCRLAKCHPYHPGGFDPVP